MVHESITVQGIRAANVPQVWETVAPLLEKAIHPGQRDIWDVFEDVWNGSAQLWVGQRNGEIIAAMTTRIMQYPQGKIALIEHVGGEFNRAFIGYLPRLKQWAAAAGADYIRLCGRKGWLRLLKGHFSRTFYMMEDRTDGCRR